MEAVLLIGRIIVGVYFLFNAFNHFTKSKMMAPYAASKGVPLPAVAVPGTGVLLALGGLSVALGFYTWVGALLLVVFLVPVAFIMHNFWTVKDPQMKMLEMVNFTKNLGLAGALLMVLAYAVESDWSPFTLAG
ncbi:MAG: hypothetical protein HW388_117 [Dehalococcoidia bacterium]|nr:hypothetical protein [Dehalococcoidia bacterium]